MTAQATLHLLKANLTIAGIELPEEVADALAAYNQTRERLTLLRDDRAAAPSAIPGAILAAITAGRDPLADKGVARALTYRGITGSLDQADSLAATAAVEAIHAARHEITDRLRTGPFAEAREKLERAYAIIGDGIELDNHGGLIARGPDHAAAWGDAHSGIRTMSNIGELWARTHEPNSPADARFSVLILATPDDGNACAFPRVDTAAQRHFSVWDSLRAGWTLDLARDPAEVKARLDAIEAHYQSLDDEARNPYNSGYRPLGYLSELYG